jgi:hypothetical protein
MSTTSNVVLTVSAEATITASSSDEWFFDNGATKHVTNRCDVFLTFEKFDPQHPQIVRHLQAVGEGTIRVLSNVEDQQQSLTLADVWYVPKISKNLVSVVAAQDENPVLQFFTRQLQTVGSKLMGK